MTSPRIDKPLPMRSTTTVKTRPYASMRTIGALILREMSTRYGRIPGGYVWALFEPLGAILLLSVGFSLLIAQPSLGTSFILFYATGYLAFSLYQSISVLVARSINFSRPLLRYPSVTWLDAVLARFSLNLLTEIMVTYCLLTAILLSSDTKTVIQILPILQAMIFAAFIGLGVGVLNCFLIGILPMWDILWSVVTRPLFLASGVMFIYEDMPSSVQSILWYNPILHVTGLMRMGIYPMYKPSYISIPYLLYVGLITLSLGMLFLHRHHRTILNR